MSLRELEMYFTRDAKAGYGKELCWLNDGKGEAMDNVLRVAMLRHPTICAGRAKASMDGPAWDTFLQIWQAENLDSRQ